MTTTTARKRRASAEVKRLIAHAASAEFAEKGFERTTIRSVARRAGVTESMVFRHFESKAELFRSTAAAPLVEFMNEFAGAMGDDPRQDPYDVTLRFADGLYALCSTNRHILMSLAAGASDRPATAAASPLAPCLQALIDGVHEYMENSGTAAASDMRSTVRLAVALVLGTALAGEALFPPDTAECEIPSALARFILHGADYRPASTADDV
ncbi:TetR/AcrR family transcriptional regulator [Nocardia sp. alder85J]|uniref:TetR/AcrR family transcriptional regulator n=1 Tax=Nocardia sp. alder85J TaxID=2862949 RepID=UPI001CD7BAD2|nr:TetR/AcrR family transcriptional regulator [Nocardia sp. alder85J]MCX4095725.1 helix-turn-helix domain containing protein [Nocardia sp. alder85J]